jgi:hypothetical protein
MWKMSATVVSTTLEEPLDWPNATVVSGDAVDVVARLKEESEVPLRSHDSLSINRALMAAGLVDRVQLTLFPVITERKGQAPATQPDPQRLAAQDTEAKTAARTAMTALEVFYTDHQTYVGGDERELIKFTPELAEGAAVTLAVSDLSKKTYTLSIRSGRGTKFIVTRTPAGTVSRDCSAPASGGCGAGGAW